MKKKVVAPSRRYAYRTTVPPSKSMLEIQQIIARFGAKNFAFGTNNGRSVVMFESEGMRIRFDVPPPDPCEFWNKNDIEAEERRLWRSLAMAIKAKLEIITSGISTFQQEMLPYALLPDGRTFAEAAREPRFQEALMATAREVPMLPGGEP